MKKLLLTLTMLLASAAFIFAQEEVSEAPAEQTAEVQAEKSAGGKVGFRTGVYGQYLPVFGDLSDYVSGSAGGGLALEYDFLTVGSGMKLGAALHAAGNICMLKTELVNSMWNAQVLGGIYFRIPFGSSGFILQPEVDYGCCLNFPTVNPDYPNELASMYIDQLIQAAVSFRYNPSFANGLMEFEITPVYNLCTEQSGLIHYAGVRAGILLNF